MSFFHLRLCLAATLLGLLDPARAAEPALLASTDLAAPAGLDSGESSLARGPDGTLYLTWAGPAAPAGERALRLATLAPDATAWSAPRTIIQSPLLMENWADFASLAVGADGTLTAQWFQRHPGEDSHGYDGWFARSRDGGATWTSPAPLGHEFVSLAALSGGRTLAVWLASTRVRDPHAAGGKHDDAPAAQNPAAPSAPTMALRARLLAPDGSTLQDWLVDPDTCTCCQTSLAVLPGDRAIVAYRGHTAGEIRDNRIALFTGTGWTPPRALHEDGWKIPGCPVNGPAVDTLGERTAIAWFTAAGGVARVQAKLSLDGGLTFGPPLAVDLGRPLGRLDLVMLADGSAVVSWLEAGTAQNAAGLYVRRLFPDGRLSAARLLAPTSAIRASGFARLAARPGRDLPVVISWTEAVPAADPQGPAATRVHTAEFFASALTADRGAFRPANTSRLLAVIRPETIEFLELCALPANGTSHP